MEAAPEGEGAEDENVPLNNPENKEEAVEDKQTETKVVSFDPNSILVLQIVLHFDWIYSMIFSLLLIVCHFYKGKVALSLTC